VTGSGPWNWTCPGLNGGNAVNCSAAVQGATVAGYQPMQVTCGTPSSVPAVQGYSYYSFRIPVGSYSSVYMSYQNEPSAVFSDQAVVMKGGNITSADFLNVIAPATLGYQMRYAKTSSTGLDAAGLTPIANGFYYALKKYGDTYGQTVNISSSVDNVITTNSNYRVVFSAPVDFTAILETGPIPQLPPGTSATHKVRVCYQ
jgi:hypothetical protein